jgi:methylated-DNA-[protein]-cysteine S-methyltransferase
MFQCLETPIGWLKIEGNETAVTKIWFEEPEPPSSDCPPNSAIEKAYAQLSEYFEGKRTSFDFAVQLNGTPFQQKVWEALRHIPYGQTRSYGDIAKSFQQPNLSRAIGMANGKNPICIVIPCHRVIGENGKLTGYAGGLWRKQWLLEHESKSTTPKLF